MSNMGRESPNLSSRACPMKRFRDWMHRARQGGPQTDNIARYSQRFGEVWGLSVRCNTAVMLVLLAAVQGCKTGGGPSRFESAVAREVKQKITIGGKDWKNPIPTDEANASLGGEHFQHHCMVCHGLDGHATGVPFASKMDPPVPDLSSRNVQDYTDGQLKWIIQNGIAPSGMPGWAGILEDKEMWQVVAYLRHLPPPGSLGAPAVFRESEAQHEASEGKPKAKTPPKSRHKHTHTHTQTP